MTSAHLLTSEDVTQWKNLSPTSYTFFQKYAWNDLLSKAYSYPDYSLVAGDGHEGFAVLPLKLVKSPLLGNRLISVPFSDYGGPTRADPARQMLLLEEAAKLSRGLRTSFLELRLNRLESPGLISEVERRGFKLAREYSSFLVDLRGGERRTWRRISSSARRGIVKSQESGVEVREATTRADLQSYHSLYLASSREHGSPAHPFRFLSELFVKLKPEKGAKLLIASHRGKDLSGLLLLCHGANVHYWQSALPSRHRALNPFHRLLWNAVSTSIAEGYELFDLGRTRKKSGIYRFKQAWGGIEYQLDHYCLFHGKPKRLADPEDLRYRTASRLWKKVPRSVTARLEPRLIREIAL